MVTILAPMKRGLKATADSETLRTLAVTILAPMKRGLKDNLFCLPVRNFAGYNPCPDEKGTESSRPPLASRHRRTLQSLPR